MKKLTSEQYSEMLKERYNELFSESHRRYDMELEFELRELSRRIEYFIDNELVFSSFEKTYEDWSKLSID